MPDLDRRDRIAQRGHVGFTLFSAAEYCPGLLPTDPMETSSRITLLLDQRDRLARVLLEQRLCCHLEDAHVACHLIGGIGVDVCGEALTELTQHGGHVFLRDGVRRVQVHDRLLQIPAQTGHR